MPSQPIATWMTLCDSCRVEVPGTGRRRHTIGLIPGSQTLSCRALPAYGLGKGACLSRMAASDRVSSGDLADAASSVPGTPRTLVVPQPVQQRVRYRRLFASGRVRGSPVPSGPPTHEIPDSPETPHSARRAGRCGNPSGQSQAGRCRGGRTYTAKPCKPMSRSGLHARKPTGGRICVITLLRR